MINIYFCKMRSNWDSNGSFLGFGSMDFWLTLDSGSARRVHAIGHFLCAGKGFRLACLGFEATLRVSRDWSVLWLFSLQFELAHISFCSIVGGKIESENECFWSCKYFSSLLWIHSATDSIILSLIGLSYRTSIGRLFLKWSFAISLTEGLQHLWRWIIDAFLFGTSRSFLYCISSSAP